MHSVLHCGIFTCRSIKSFPVNWKWKLLKQEGKHLSSCDEAEGSESVRCSKTAQLPLKSWTICAQHCNICEVLQNEEWADGDSDFHNLHVYIQSTPLLQGIIPALTGCDIAVQESTVCPLWWSHPLTLAPTRSRKKVHVFKNTGMLQDIYALCTLQCLACICIPTGVVHEIRSQDFLHDFTNFMWGFYASHVTAGISSATCVQTCCVIVWR